MKKNSPGKCDDCCGICCSDSPIWQVTWSGSGEVFDPYTGTVPITYTDELAGNLEETSGLVCNWELTYVVCEREIPLVGTEVTTLSFSLIYDGSLWHASATIHYSIDTSGTGFQRTYSWPSFEAGKKACIGTGFILNAADAAVTTTGGPEGCVQELTEVVFEGIAE